jgi:dynein heavy chain
MTIMLIEGDGLLNKIELDFFLKGNTALESVQRPKPYKWLTEGGWKDMQKLVTIGEEYKNLVNDLENNESEWKKWYDLEKPENEEMPREFGKLSNF